MTVDISIRLLGIPEIASPSEGAVFPSRGFCLLALLVLTPSRRLTRAQAAAQLWDSESTTANLANLRQLLLRMQKAMPALSSILGVDNHALWLTQASGKIDLCKLMDLAGESPSETLRSLLSLYCGDLLQGVDAGSEPLRYALMLSTTVARDRYFSILAECLKGLTRYGDADISLLRAVELHALSIDRGREETYRSLITSYGAIGQPEEARRVYRALVESLRLDESGPPIQETKASLVRAMTRIVDRRAERAVGDRGPFPGPPRVALLAPRWVFPTADRHNFYRSLVEDIANELARYRTLVTIAPHSSFRVTDDGGFLEQDQTLRADYCISSSIQPDDAMGTLCLRLVNSRTAAIVWAEEFPLRQERLVSTSRALIARIAANVSGAIESDTFRLLERTGSSSSYLLFLQGQNALKTCDLRSVRRARRHYVETIKEDNSFAEAYSGVSCSLYLEWLLLGGNDPRLLSEARELADAAIERDPTSSSGYWRKAMVALYQHDFDRSEECFQRAQDLHPNSADIMLDHSDAMGFVGDANEAWTTFQRALDLNPTPPDHYWWAGASIAFSRADYGKAVELCGRLDNDESVLRLLAASHGQLGNIAQAREYGRRLAEAYPGQSAEVMTRLQPHRSRQDLLPFIEGLQMAGVR